jgi:hypothetical protein
MSQDGREEREVMRARERESVRKRARRTIKGLDEETGYREKSEWRKRTCCDEVGPLLPQSLQ